MEEFKYMGEDPGQRAKAEECNRLRVQKKWMHELRKRSSQACGVQKLEAKRIAREFRKLGQRCWRRWRVLFVAGLMGRRNVKLEEKRVAFQTIKAL